ncbi:MAG: hypothetical protein HOP27_07470 [Anaerolineales bacterium]|nr:hypothetical protein [Anaerolineales bacterium]
MATKIKPADDNYVRMFYEHQYDRMGKGESYRLTITNYVLTVSALAFTFGYQNSTQLTIMNGIGLPLVILIVNIFAIAYIDRTSEVINIHLKRARAVLDQYAPQLNKINNAPDNTIPKGFLGGQRGLQKALHILLILVALVPVIVYLYQFI